MVVNKFQSESVVAVRELQNTPSRFETTPLFSDHSLATTLNSVLLGFIIRKYLTPHDIESLQQQFSGSSRIMIVTDNNCIYPIGDDKGECSLCVVIKDNQINVCDLQSKHTELVDTVEDAWPSLLDTATKIENSFSNTAGAILVNRLSGRVIAASKRLAALTGIAQIDIEGREYGQVSRKIAPIISGKKLIFENVNTGEISLALITKDSPTSGIGFNDSSGANEKSSSTGTYQLIEEPDTIGLHFSRFNALLGERLHLNLSIETVAQIESVVAEMLTFEPELNSIQNKACLRLLVQSLFMAHSSYAGASSNTDVVVNHDKQSIKFETSLTIEQTNTAESKEWLSTAEAIAKNIGVTIGELKMKKKTIISTIELTKERI